MHALLLTAALAAPPAPAPLDEALPAVTARTLPAVVGLAVTRRSGRAPELQELLQLCGVKDDPEEEVVGEATGSGAIVLPSGRVLTNHHVVDRAAEISVILQDRRRLPATLVAADPRTDLAILQIDAPGPFPHLPLGDSEAVRVGELVVAVGSPFDFQSTLTFGVISAKGRRGLGGREIQDYLQTDAAVNPGSSGGPLLNLRGEIVGINTAIYSPGADQNSGVSFAIPSNLAARVERELLATGRVARPHVGLAVGDSDEDGLPGAEVLQVRAGGPAERAGLRRGDVLVAVDGDPVVSAGDLRDRLLSRPIDVDVALEVARGAQRVALTVRPVAEQDLSGSPDALPAEVLRWSGMTLAEPDDALRAWFGLDLERGLVVATVTPGSPAARFGVAPGDRLIEVAGESVRDLAGLRAQLDAAEPGPRVVRLARPGGEITTIIPAE